MWRPANSLQFVYRLGLSLTVAGFVFGLRPLQDVDSGFYPQIASPAFQRIRTPPLILIDEAHTNTHTIEGRFSPLARLAKEDGYRVSPNLRRFSEGSLQGAAILIIGNALGWKGALQQGLHLVGLEGSVSLPVSAFDADEIGAVREWVRNGGSLLLTADHAPCGRAAQPLAAEFGVTMTDGYTEDPVHHDSEGGVASFLLFTRENNLLEEHPIMEGRDLRERVSRAVSFTGQALWGPAKAVTLLRLSDTAVSYPRRRSSRTEAQSAAGLAQGLAMEFGKGRVVVLGETSMITAQRARVRGGEFYFGMNRRGNDNQRLALNILHWLSQLI